MNCNCSFFIVQTRPYIIYLYLHCNFICGLSDVIKTFSQSVSQNGNVFGHVLNGIDIQHSVFWHDASVHRFIFTLSRSRSKVNVTGHISRSQELILA